ncbi:helix-turn-helix transcriptional regulator [Paenibacillus alvei]|uniref:helix-turn-helix transcriptional regulator n=1 Tax=Paenibacillus alvei TaxID=44250 RepID=UPI0013D9B0A5|nr:helix-turn-helix transcriptional regulator [Paenibacillus alvei]NEZ43490.1 helix-turn-helix domain-containing protein [Paenibacillus alvei]
MSNNAVNRLREMRKFKKKSGTAIAKMLGISPPYYYDIEKGDRNLSMEIASKLADIYGVSVDYLIGRETNGEDIENEKDFLQQLDLNNKELLEQFDLTLDGVPVTEEEAQNIIAFLRTARQMKGK